MADSTNIANITNRYTDIEHTWNNKNVFAKESNVPTMQDPMDSSNNSASTEWVNNFFGKRIPATPTINVPLLTPMWFDHSVESVAWVRSDNQRNESNNYGWLSERDYPSIYAHLAVEFASATATTETIAGITITFSRAADGHRIIRSSENSGGSEDRLFDATGVSWFYVLDTTNRRFKLPRTKFGFQGRKTGSDGNFHAVGHYDEAGIPNITGTLNAQSGKTNWSWGNGFENASGAFNTVATSQVTKIDARTVETDHTMYRTANLNASRSNSIYGKSDTVQPPTTEMFLYFSTGVENAAGGLGGGVGGGVIDGTVLDETTIEVPKTLTEVYYLTKNDCWLSILPESGDWNSESESNKILIKVNGSIVSQTKDIYSQLDASKLTFGFPVKRASEIVIVNAENKVIMDTAGSITFREFAITSIAPQIAMPDYNTNSSIVKDYGATTFTSWSADNDGYLLMYIKEQTYNLWVLINGKQIFSSSNYAHAGFSGSIAPISKGDTVTVSGSSAYIKIEFIPCKTVQQSNPPVYITKRERGIFVEEFDTKANYVKGDCYKKVEGTTTKYYIVKTAGTGDAAQKVEVTIDQVPTWEYTLYSDGYCEQRGMVYINNNIGYDNNNGYLIKFKKGFNNISYHMITSISTDKSGGYVDWGNVINELKWCRSYNETKVAVNDTAASPSFNHYIYWEAKGFVFQ